jgi:radical SAM superfamily enzyme YgiQ (UPF0313 family)
MKILIVNPFIYDFAAYDLWMKPLGLLYIVSVLKNAAVGNVEVHFFDCAYKPAGKVSEYGCSKIKSAEVEKPAVYRNIPRRYKRYGCEVSEFVSFLDGVGEPDLVLVSSGMTYWYLGVIETIRIIKDKFPKVPIILGGAYATLCYEHATAYSDADFVFKGKSIYELCGLIHSFTGIKLEVDKIPKAFREYPEPYYEFYSGLNYIVLRASVGCPFKCIYCAVPHLASSFEYKDAGTVFSELIAFYNRGFRNFAFYDDALLFHPQIKALLSKIASSGLNFKFHTPNALHAKFISDDVAKLLYSCGFVHPRIGLEAVSQEFHDFSGRKLTIDDYVMAVERLCRAGYKTGEIITYIMSSFPGRPFKELYETVKFLMRLGVRISIAEYSPVPSTGVFSTLPEEIKNEPLLHNRIAFSYFYEPSCEYKQYLEELKLEVKEHNDKISKG